VEGTLFGNGERTGNVDIVTLAMNLYTHGIHPRLDFSNINQVIECVEFCNRIPIHQRHPYAGQMVFTAFSGRTRMPSRRVLRPSWKWNVGGSYLPIDPKDWGAVMKRDSRQQPVRQGRRAYLLERDYGIRLPRRLQIEFSRVVQQISEAQAER